MLLDLRDKYLEYIQGISNWKAFVNGKEVKTGAPRFSVNTPTGYARGLTDAGILGDKTFYLSTGEWKFDLSAGKVVRCSRARSKRRQIQRRKNLAVSN